MDKTDVVLVVASVAALAGVVGQAIAPTGAIGSRLAEWRIGVTQRDALRTLWNDVVGDARIDDSSGEVWMVEFGDYECVYCRAFHEELQRFLERHPDVGVSYRQLPLVAVHPLAMDASRVSVCATRQAASQSQS